MKNLLYCSLLAFLSSTGVFASGVLITAASYNKCSQELSIDISYGGGTQQHSFELSYGPVRETYPMTVTATLLHTRGAQDPGERLNYETLTYDVSDIVRPIYVTIINEEGTSSKSVFIEEVDLKCN